MRNHAKSFLSAFLVFVLLFARVPGIVQSAQAAAPSPSTLPKNTATRHEICTDLSAQALAYYTSGNTYEDLILLDGKKTTDSTKAIGSPLFNRLKSMMQLTDSVTYKSLPEYWVYTDSMEGSDQVWLFYDDFEASSSSDYDREHVWPKSHGNFVESGAGSDLHHLRPTIKRTNSTRGNMTMGDVRSKNISGTKTLQSGGQTVLWYASSYTDNDCDGLVEVMDDVKGDVARIYLYVYVTYGNSNTNKNLFTTVDAYGADDNDGMKVMESLDTLLRWMEIDPVDEWEMRRNDLCERVQGNRNVFIDYPELAWYLFEQEDEMPDMDTPSGNAHGGSSSYTIEAVSSDTSKGTVSVSGNVITASPKEGYWASGYEVLEGEADVVQNGNNFLVTAHSDCRIKIIFEEKTKVTLTYMANGALFGTEQVYQGESHALPKNVSAPEDWTFVGWVTGQVERTSTRPGEILTDSFTPQANTTLYALFTQTEAGGGASVWTKLTSLDSLEVGTKLVFTCQQYSSVAGNLVSGKTWLEKISCTSFSGNKITTLPDGAMVFTLGGRSGAWTFTSSAGQLYCSAAKSLNFSGTGVGTWTIALNSGNAVVGSTNTSFGNLEYNSTNPRFTTYLESSNQKKIEIYYLAGGDTIYYATEPAPQLLDPPVLTGQPESLRVGEDAEAAFSVEAEGEELAYQWYVSTDGGTSFAAVTEASGQTAQYTFTATMGLNGARYYCEVSNPAGSVRSETVSLTVVAKPVITKHPQNVKTGLKKMVTFKAAATGEDLKYQWYVSTDGGKTFAKINSVAARTSKYSLRVNSASYNGYRFRCEVTNLGGTVVSQSALLSIVAVGVTPARGVAN